jgi:nucleoid-associated protein YgaU
MTTPNQQNQQGNTGASQPPTAQPQGDDIEVPVSRGTTYTVKSGDTLSKIAKHHYGDASQWRRIYDVNREQISNPDLIYPGQKLYVPQ